jgi:hypothetical protein
MNRALLLLLLCTAPLTAAEPIQQASEARLWLKVPPGSPPLGKVAVSAGGFSQADWEKDPELRRRQLDVHFPIRWWSWAPLTIHFTPAADWAALARHFQAWPPGLFFELLNEPTGALKGELLNDAIQRATTAIRTTNPQRIIVVGPGQWNSASELDQLRLPAAPVAVPAALRENQGVVAFIAAYNTQPAAQNPCSARGVAAALDTAAAWSRQFGRPVHLGEFGAFEAADHASRERYLRAVRQLAEARGIPWTLWEWKALFGYWDPAANQPRFRAALFE